MFVARTAEALASQVTEEHYAKGLLYPPFKDIRKISAQIAADVAAKAYELGEPCFVLRQTQPAQTKTCTDGIVALQVLLLGYLNREIW